MPTKRQGDERGQRQRLISHAVRCLSHLDTLPSVGPIASLTIRLKNSATVASRTGWVTTFRRGIMLNFSTERNKYVLSYDMNLDTLSWLPYMRASSLNA